MDKLATAARTALACAVAFALTLPSVPAGAARLELRPGTDVRADADERGQRRGCTGVAGCGDQHLMGIEACDDGNLRTLDGCTDYCSVEAGWQCSGEPSICVDHRTCADDPCSPFATCEDSVPPAVGPICTCGPTYHGDGYTCMPGACPCDFSIERLLVWALIAGEWICTDEHCATTDSCGFAIARFSASHAVAGWLEDRTCFTGSNALWAVVTEHPLVPIQVDACYWELKHAAEFFNLSCTQP